MIGSSLEAGRQVQQLPTRAGEAAIAGQGPQPVCQMPEVRAARGGGAIWRVHRSGSEWLLQSPAADPVIDDSAECE